VCVVCVCVCVCVCERERHYETSLNSTLEQQIVFRSERYIRVNAVYLQNKWTPIHCIFATGNFEARLANFPVWYVCKWLRKVLQEETNSEEK